MPVSTVTHLPSSVSARSNDESDVLIKAENVSKKFCRSLKKSLWYGMKDMAAELAGGSRQHNQLRKDEFWAVNDISFELKRGECLGLLGRNGAGKTTLLKMLNGLVKPDKGQITIHGRVGALIALGAGFNPILTGRENIYVNASVLGLTKREIDEKVEEIIEFSGIRAFIDTPVQNYSSGMQVRLGFAVATALDPDVLLLDEVLAVGDAEFRAKCYNRVAKLMRRSAVIFVTHSMEHIGQICTDALFLANGSIVAKGDPVECIREYEKANTSPLSNESFTRIEPPVCSFELEIPLEINYGEGLLIRCSANLDADIFGCFARVSFYGPSGGIAAEYSTASSNQTFDLKQGMNHLKVQVPAILLRDGSYSIAFVLHDNSGFASLAFSRNQYAVRISGSPQGFADYLIT